MLSFYLAALESGGDRKMFAEIYQRYHVKMERTAMNILRDQSEAEDAVQDAFIRFLERAPEQLGTPDAWLMRVLMNGCKGRLRLAWRRVGPLPETLAVPGPEEREELEELFSLPPEDRAVIHLHYYEGWSTDEIARMLGQRPGTVRSRLSRARGKLRKLLEKELQGGTS